MPKKAIDLNAQHYAALPAGLLVCDARAKVVHVNAHAEAALGKDADVMLGKKSWSAFFDKRGPTLLDAAFDEACLQEGTVHLSNGDHVYVRAECMFDDDGEVDGVVASVSPVPSATSAAADGATAAVKGALDVATSAVMMASNERVITYVNQAAQAMFDDAESDIQQALPHFKAADVVGSNIDGFHKNPSHQAGMLAKLQDTHRAQIEVGARTFQVIATPMFDDDGERGGFVVEWQDLTQHLAKEREERARADATAAVKGALDVATSAVMMANSDRVITYVNQAAQAMFDDAEEDIQDALPHFDAANVVGSNIDGFHKNPSHQAKMLANLTDTHKAQIEVGVRTFQVIATPTFDEGGGKSGFVVEWQDLTQQLAKEREERAQAAAVAAVKGALDVATSAVMMASNDRVITYVNHAAQAMFDEAESDIQQALPQFVAADVVGSSIDGFHKNPAHQAGMLAKLTSTHKAQIEVGPRTFQVIATPTFAPDGEKTGFVVEWQDLTQQLAKEREERRLAEHMARVGGALDKTSTNLMIADTDYNIIYMNESVHEMMRGNAHELGAMIPGFDAENLLGQNIDIFHRNPGHQRRLLDGLRDEYKAKLKVGSLHMQIVANPVFDDDGARQGTVVEWEDQTAQVKAAEERESIQQKIKDDAEELERNVDTILQVVRAAAAGDFSKEVPDLGTDAVGQLADGVGQMIGNVKDVVSEIQGLISAAQDGRLDHRGQSARFTGGFADVVNGVNDTVDALMAPVTQAQQALDLLASYDLRARITDEYAGDHNRIKDALNQTGEVLHTAISQVAEAVNQMLSASDQIAKSSQEVADGASTQASSLEETSASLEEMSGMTKLNADNAQQADAMAKAAQVAAGKGSDAMQSMNTSMSKIRQSSEDTSAIIKDINEIAFQTNLLALNAAVEAARAGDAGRGFAVVAEEVRNLAQRSKEAAQKTETLINQSVKLAEAGGRITQDATQQLGEITDAIGKVTALVGEIAQASSEQARGIEQINTAVTSMDRVTQANASASEESSSAAEELAGQARELQTMVSRFQLHDSSPSVAMRQRASSSAYRVPLKPRVSTSAPPPSTSKVKPQDLIPLDDDPDFAEF